MKRSLVRTIRRTLPSISATGVPAAATLDPVLADRTEDARTWFAAHAQPFLVSRELGIQRIVYAGNEANYCPRCQTAGRVLADRALSRLLKEDWPKTMEELERRLPARGEPGM